MSKKSKAVALKYNVEEDLAPIVIASGYGEVAQRIILLCMLEVGSNIPPELYQVVAAIYCQLLKTSYKLKNGHDPLPKGNGASGLPGGF